MDKTLKDFRVEKGFSQSKAASELGITQDYLSMIENNRRSPSSKLMEKMANVYDQLPEVIFLTARRTYSGINNKKEAS